MCSPLDPLSCPDAITRGIVGAVSNVVTDLATTSLDSLLSALTWQLHAAIELLSLTLAGWILVPSTRVCPDTAGDWTRACASAASPSAQVRGWLLPLTALIAVLGIVWQGITMTITRKGEPLLTVLKGLSATALWGAAGLAGTQLALRAGDAYAYWILQQAIFGDSTNPTRDLGAAIGSMSTGESGTAALVMVLLQVPFLLATLTQILLMIFREGAVVILAGQLQLAAAGGFTRLTSGWLAKVTGWMLALIAYKPIAATIYAVAFALMGDGVRNLLMGLAVMIMAVVAMPALMRLFNWSVGAVASNANAVGMLGSAVAAGLHGASALGGLGGYGPAEHARWLDTHGPTGGGGPPAGLPSGPGGATATGSSGAGIAATGAASGSAASSAAGAAGGAGAAAATGGATLAADAAVQAAGQVREQVHRAADAAGDAMDGR